MELSPEERQKIYEEEKARLEAQEKLKNEKATAQARTGCTGCLVVIGIIVAIVALSAVFGGGGDKSTTSTTVTLNARVQFTGTQFVIVNNDSFDWTNVRLNVNSAGLSSGYTLTTPVMKAGETYTVGAMQFAKSDGTRFNPFQVKPKNFSIFCDTPSDDGFWFGSWE